MGPRNSGNNGGRVAIETCSEASEATTKARHLSSLPIPGRTVAINQGTPVGIIQGTPEGAQTDSGVPLRGLWSATYPGGWVRAYPIPKAPLLEGSLLWKQKGAFQGVPAASA